MRLSKRAFTLVEVMMTVGILVVTILGLIRFYLFCSTQSDLSQRLTSAAIQAQTKLEEIRNTNYASIAANYASGGSPGNTFNLNQMNGKGVIYINSSNTDLLQIEVVVSFSNQSGLIVGEDKNFNGTLDPGEDLNGNGKFDSEVDLITMIAKK